MALKLPVYLVILVIAVVGFEFFRDHGDDGDGPPYLPEKFNWKRGSVDVDGDSDTSIRPFKINVSDQVLDDLKVRLAHATNRLMDPLEDAAFTYGFNTDFLRKVQEFWLNEYNWREREALLNKYNQYNTTIEGLDIHFYHVKPANSSDKEVIPLLLIHGWPYSVADFQKVIPLLTTARSEYDFVFELVIPSLPGYGFSSPAEKMGMGPTQMAKILRKLMQRLGHEKFYAQGGDWGFAVASSLGFLYPSNVRGIHLNQCASLKMKTLVKHFLGAIWSWPFTSSEEAATYYPISNHIGEVLQESGYMHLHATKPDTVSIALNDSPIGLAAYILEKYSTGTNVEWRNLPDGGLPGPFAMDELLDNVMVYWITGSIVSANRIYKEFIHFGKMGFLDEGRVKVPTVCARFPDESYVLWSPESLLRDRYVNLTRWATMQRGGHFAALEVPEILADDLWKSIDHMM